MSDYASEICILSQCGESEFSDLLKLCHVLPASRSAHIKLSFSSTRAGEAFKALDRRQEDSVRRAKCSR